MQENIILQPPALNQLGNILHIHSRDLVINKNNEIQYSHYYSVTPGRLAPDDHMGYFKPKAIPRRTHPLQQGQAMPAQ